MPSQMVTRYGKAIEDPPFLKILFTKPQAGWLWLVPRLWLGYKWIEASSHKITNPSWVQTGEALKGFWTAAVAVPKSGHPAITFAWYRTFLQTLLDVHAYGWFAKMIVVGELAVGAALLVGAFSGFAALFGAFMNWNFMMSGSAGANPVFFVLAVGLLLSWKVCGYFGADYLLLRWIGTPWSRPKADSLILPERGRGRQLNAQPS